MRIIKLQGVGSFLKINLVNHDLIANSNSRIALLGWFFSANDKTIEGIKDDCFELHCSIVPQDLVAICSPEVFNCPKSIIDPRYFVKGNYQPSNPIFLKVREGPIKDISIQIKTNNGNKDVLDKVRSTVYLLTNNLHIDE